MIESIVLGKKLIQVALFTNIHVYSSCWMSAEL